LIHIDCAENGRTEQRQKRKPPARADVFGIYWGLTARLMHGYREANVILFERTAINRDQGRGLRTGCERVERFRNTESIGTKENGRTFMQPSSACKVSITSFLAIERPT
jgi:hypothetical protein